MKRILIIYAKAGGGHWSLAQALEESLLELTTNNPSTPLGAGYQLITKLVDPFPRLYSSTYRKVGADFHSFYGRNYSLTNRPEVAKALHTLNYLVIGPRLNTLFRAEKPDLIISVYPLATGELVRALKEINHPAKVVILFADPFSVHKLWLSFREANLYLSPTPECSKQAAENGLPAEKIKTVGWLVRRQFRETISDRLTLRKNLGLAENKFTIFLGGSGSGGGRIFETAQLLARNLVLAEKGQLIVAAGNNRQLLTKLLRLSEDRPGFFYLLPYVNNIPQLLRASDLVVGKAGPNLLFESIFMERPFLATGCLPGQEEGNLEFIKRENLGWVEERLEEAAELISELVDQKKLVEAKMANLKRVKADHANANQKAAEAIFDLLKD